MFVSGFTIARNVLKADYPLKEAVFSILPLCDEMIIAVGKSDDDTLAHVQSFGDPKIKIIETVWDDDLREGGRVLAHETNKALDATNPYADWCFYIQADECIHEKYHPYIKKSMQQWKDHEAVEGLLFDYIHFYGSYDYVGDSRRWYRKETRIIRRNPAIRSYADAQGFRKHGNQKISVKPSGGAVFHYGWVKHPDLQQEKQMQARKFWHDDAFMEKHVARASGFDYSNIDSLAKFKGSHPKVMQERIARQNWSFDYDISKKRFNMKTLLLYWIEKLTGWRVGEFKNHKVI